MSVATPPKNFSTYSTMEECFNCGLAIRRETFNGGEPWLHGWKGFLTCIPIGVKQRLAALIDAAGAASLAEDTDRHMDGYPREELTSARIGTSQALREFCVANKEVICR